MADSTGVVYGLPHALHEWAPEPHAGSMSAALGLAVSAAGSATRQGSTALALPLACTTAGRGTRVGTLSLALPLSRTTAGLQLAAIRVGSATARLVAITLTAAGKATRSGSSTPAQLLASVTASGQASKTSQLYGSVTLSLSAAGGKTVSGQVSVLLAQPVTTAGIRSEYVFLSPTTDDVARVNPSVPRLMASTPYGLTVWRDADGAWHTKFSPHPDRLAGADRVYPGGREAPMTDASRAELIAAGFASNITLKEYR